MINRRKRGHPWLFMLVAGTAVAAACAGDIGHAAVLGLLALFLVRH